MAKVLEVNNLLIVESENDKFFIQSLINHLNININFGTPICSIDEYECLGGISKLEHRLKALIARVSKENIQKIGIVFDADKVGIEKQTADIQEKIDLIFHGIADIDFSIYIMNVEGHGELETVLKKIALKDATVANCLQSWQECLKDKELNQKEFDKVWIQMYQRYDCCTKKEAKQAGKNCNNEISFSKSIYDLNNPILDKLKTFLQELGAN